MNIRRAGAILIPAAFVLLGCSPALTADAPAAAIQPGVRAGGERIKKSVFLTLGGIGLVTDIQYGKFGSGLTDLAVAGNYGARLFDERLGIKRTIGFEMKNPEGFPVASRIVRPTALNGLLFFRQSNFTYASLDDDEGKELWRTPYDPSASTFGDSGSGSPNFFFATRDGSIEARNLLGAVLWKTAVDHNVFDLAFLAPRSADGASILANVAGSVVGLAADGHPVFNRRLPLSG